MTYIHPTAIIYPNVHIGDNVYIGAYSVIGAPPEHPDEVDPRDIDDNDYHVRGIHGVSIHDNTIIREHVTINGGFINDTIIGKNCYIMCHAHVGHDTIIGDNTTLHTSSVIGGHCQIETRCRIGLNATLHQHTTLASGTMVGAQAFVKGNWNKPFRILAGVPAKDIGPNQRLIDKLGIVQ